MMLYYFLIIALRTVIVLGWLFTKTMLYKCFLSHGRLSVPAAKRKMPTYTLHRPLQSVALGIHTLLLSWVIFFNHIAMLASSAIWWAVVLFLWCVHVQTLQACIFICKDINITYCTLLCPSGIIHSKVFMIISDISDSYKLEFENIIEK